MAEIGIARPDEDSRAGPEGQVGEEGLTGRSPGLMRGEGAGRAGLPVCVA